jgi:hypothetical protein
MTVPPKCGCCGSRTDTSLFVSVIASLKGFDFVRCALCGLGGCEYCRPMGLIKAGVP